MSNRDLIFPFGASTEGNIGVPHVTIYGIQLSLRQLKRILSRRGSRRRNNTSDMEDILKLGHRDIAEWQCWHSRLSQHVAKTH